MKAKEKAKELISSFLEFAHTIECATIEETERMEIENAKQCALICVEEEIALYNELMSLGLLKENSIGLELAELKQEIERL